MVALYILGHPYVAAKKQLRERKQDDRVFRTMRVWMLVLLVLSPLLGVGCSGKHEQTEAERQQVRDGEVASFANASHAAVVPKIKDSGVTLDWQEALRGTSTTFAFRGSVDDIYEKDGKYFLNVSDI